MKFMIVRDELHQNCIDHLCNASQLQWRNRLARRTYMTDTGICGGCEFEPHLEHKFINHGFTKWYGTTDGAANFQKSYSTKPSCSSAVFLANLWWSNCRAFLQISRDILRIAWNFDFFESSRSFSNMNAERWRFLRYVSVLCGYWNLMIRSDPKNFSSIRIRYWCEKYALNIIRCWSENPKPSSYQSPVTITLSCHICWI